MYDEIDRDPQSEEGSNGMSEHGEVLDGWAEEVSAPAGRLTDGAAALLMDEAADLARNLETRDPEWHGRSLRRLGACSFRGGLLAFDPVGDPGRPLRFPVEVAEGVYPAYVVDADATDFMVVRLGGGRPASWREVRTEDGDEAFFPIEAATYAIADERTYEGLVTDESVREAAKDLILESTCEALPGRPDFGLATASGYTDQLVWGYVGLTAEGQVAAVAVALLTDCIYTYRPATLDSEAVARCKVLVDAIPANDADEDEIRSYLWPALQQEFTQGVLTADGRNKVYEILAMLED